jgi:osmoprotectant transport system substrate-binding protein
MRITRKAALGATFAALLVGACTSGGSSPSPSAAASASAQASASPAESPAGSAGPSVASQLVFGGPPECPERPFCLIGLQETYGLEFKEFVPLDVGGTLTVEALKSGDIQLGMLFSSDAAYEVNGFVLLEDDKLLQLSDNLIPVVRTDALGDDDVLTNALNSIMAKLSQDELVGLNKAVTVDGETSADAAAAWLEANDILTEPVDSIGRGPIVVGSTNFYEQEILGELFAQTLEHFGWEVEKKFQLGNREAVFPALESGELDVLAEYAATMLEFVNEGAGEATSDVAETSAALVERLEPLGLTALDYAEATNQNGYAVTQETADQYDLTTISDLANPAP